MAEGTPSEEIENDRRIAEYQAAQACWLHHDNFQWCAGGLLIVGNFVLWGAVAGAAKMDAIIIGVASTLVTALMSVWILYAHQVRQIYLCKIDRLQELEEKLEMEQNRRFNPKAETEKYYRYFGPSGWKLNLWIYRITALGGPAIGLTRIDFDLWMLVLIVPVALFVIVSCKLACNERQFQRMTECGFHRG